MPDERHVDELLGGYVDAELDPATRAGVEAHLHACSVCRRDLEALQALQATLRAIEVPDPGPGYWARFSPRVLDRLADAAAQPPNEGPAPMLERLTGWFLPRGRPAWPRFAGAFASVMLITYIGMRGFRSDEIRIEPTKERTARETSRAPTAPTPALEQKAAAQQPVPSVSQPLEPPSLPPASPPRGEPMPRRDTGSLVEADKAEEGGASGRTSAPQTQQTFEKATPDAGQRSKTTLDALKLAAPKSATSPASSGEAMNLNAAVEAEVSVEADVAAGPIHEFVDAALAADIAAAERVRAELDTSTDVDPRDLEHMDAWLRQPPTRSPAAKEANRSAAEAVAEAEAYPALDALLWPRRQRQEFRPQVEELARRLMRQAETSPALRDRAGAYLTWLVESAPDAASRAAWQLHLDALPR